MKLHIAATSATNLLPFINGGGFDDLAPRANILESFLYIADWQKRNIHKFKSFMLDSGAFTFAYGNGRSLDDIDGYLASYIDFINENDIDLFFELDIDALVGYERVKQMRKRLESETGKQCIPVWHVPRGWNEWLNLCDEYDYIALGGIVGGEWNDLRCIKAFTREAAKHGTKVHGLGYTRKNLAELGFHSVDSSSWLMGNRTGLVYEFRDGYMLKHPAPKGYRIVDNETAEHNLVEWVRYSEYLEKTTEWNI